MQTHRITPTIYIGEDAGIRTLYFGESWVQGAMRVEQPWHLELDYTREMMASTLFRKKAHFPSNVLLIGLGAASLTKFLYRFYPYARLTVVELEPVVVKTARQFFNLPENPERLGVVIADGAEFIRNDTGSYDLILVDGFNRNGLAAELNTPSFYQAAMARLSEDGIMAVNLLEESHDFQGSLERIDKAALGRSLPFPSCDGNVIAFAAAGKPVSMKLDDLIEDAILLKNTTGLDLLPTLSRLKQAQVCLNGFLEI